MYEKDIKKSLCIYKNKKYICLFPNDIKKLKIKIIKKQEPYYNRYRWTFKYEFLKIYQEFLDKNIKNKKIKDIKDGYIFKIYIWPKNLYNLIEKKNYKPSTSFIKYILKDTKQKYIRITKNDLLIFKSLLNIGGYKKMYSSYDLNEEYKNAEHLGYFTFKKEKNDFNEEEINIKDIIISNYQSHKNKNDTTIYLPSITDKKYFSQKYIFHTHPPTPYPGGRASLGIILELPSTEDIFAFIYCYLIKHKLKGSLVFAPEGIYNIGFINLNNKQLFTDIKNKSKKNIIYNDIKTCLKNTHLDLYDKYETNFNLNTFYNNIAEDYDFINNLNNCLKKYNIYIKYYPIQKDINDEWVYGTIYLKY